VAANNLAWIYAEEGKFDDALRLAKVAQERLRRRPEAEDTLGWIYLRKGQPIDAIAAFQRASDRAPKNPVYHYHLGLAFLDSGDTKRGRQSLERALALSAKFEGADAARAKLAELSRGDDGSIPRP
jgi:tetratricopeptide (TPR) repeat protein